MTPTPTQIPVSPEKSPAERLLALLEQENEALTTLDYPAATGLIEAKRAALAELVTAGPPGLATAEALRDRAAENQLLLERAIVVQSRVIDTVLQAIPKARSPRYARTGGLLVGHPGAVALLARA